MKEIHRRRAVAFIRALTAACVVTVGGSGCRSEKSAPRALKQSEALAIIDQTLENPEHDVMVHPGEGMDFLADAVGEYRGHTVAVRYGVAESRGYFPVQKEDAEYILEISHGTAGQIRAAMDRLATLKFPSKRGNTERFENAKERVKMTSRRERREEIRYLGGLKDLRCLPGMRVNFHARFTSEENLSVRYFVDGDEVEEQKYSCEVPGTYVLQAKAYRGEKPVARSPKTKITVEEMPEELQEMQELDPSQHVHF